MNVAWRWILKFTISFSRAWKEWNAQQPGDLWLWLENYNIQSLSLSPTKQAALRSYLNKCRQEKKSVNIQWWHYSFVYMGAAYTRLHGAKWHFMLQGQLEIESIVIEDSIVFLFNNSTSLTMLKLSHCDMKKSENGSFIAACSCKISLHTK